MSLKKRWFPIKAALLLLILALVAPFVFAANDLSTYPSFLFAGGKLDATLVLGDTASVEDVIGAIDIALSLQGTCAAPTVPSAPGSPVVENGYAVERPGQKLYYGDTLSGVRSILTSSDLPTLLADGQVVDEEGTAFSYSQQLRLPAAAVSSGKDVPDTPAPIVFLDFHNGESYTYELYFPESVNLTELADSQINLMGKTYFLSADPTDLSASQLVLFDLGIHKTITAGEKATVTVDGTDSDIQVVGVNTGGNETSAMLTINGESRQVTAGNLYNIGGMRVYVKDIFSYTVPTAAGAVDLFIGGGKLTLTHNSQVRKGKANTVVDGTTVTFTQSAGLVSRIAIQAQPKEQDPETEFIAEGASYADPVFNSYQILFAGKAPSPYDPSRDAILLEPSGDDKLRLTFPNRAGAMYMLDILAGNATTNETFLANDKDPIIVNGSLPIPKKGYFIVTTAPYSRILRLSNIHNSSTHTIQVTDAALGGAATTWTYDATTHNGTMIYDGVEYPFTVLAEDSIRVNAGVSNELYTRSGALITLPRNAATSNNITLYEKTAYMEQQSPDDWGKIDFPISYAPDRDEDMRVEKPVLTMLGGWPYPTYSTSGAPFLEDVDNSSQFVGGSVYGTGVLWDDEAYEVTVVYAGKQMYYQVFIAPTGAQAVLPQPGSTPVLGAKVLPGVAKLASQIADPKAQNLIVVGGSCINSVAASLLGVGAGTCGNASGVPENAGQIKLVENSGKVAVLVAGWTSKDTLAATKALSDFASGKLSGASMTVTQNGNEILLSKP